MTINEAVSLLRGSLKLHEINSEYEDPYLWRLFSAGLALSKTRKLERYKYLNPSFYHTFCIEMIDGLTHECNCIIEGCPALVSKYPIPSTITSNINNTLVVKTLGGESIPEIHNQELLQSFRYDEAYKNKKLYIRENNKIKLPNQTNPRYLQLTAIWDNIADWADIQYCQESQNINLCNIYATDIGIDGDMIPEVLEYCFRQLGFVDRFKVDNLSDNNSEIK